MIKQLFPVIVLLILSCVRVEAQEVPGKLYGNWLSKDGSNRFIFGLTENVAIYGNDYWSIKNAAFKGDHLQLTIAHQQQTKILDLFLSEGKDTLLTEGSNTYAISKILHYNTRYKPADKQWKEPWFRQGTAHIKGVFPRFADNPRSDLKWHMDYHEVQFSYYNVFLGKTVYYYATCDSRGTFELDIPVFKPQLIELRDLVSRKKPRARFVIEPGDSILIVKDNNYYANGIDKNAVLQLTAFMGDNADFNNLYQFAIPEFGFKALVPSGQMSFATQYSQLNQAIENMFDPSISEERFLNFLREEIAYSISDLTEEFKLDESDIPVMDSVFRIETPSSLLHDNFYIGADWFSRGKYLDLPEEKRKVGNKGEEIVPAALRDLGKAIAYILNKHYTDVEGPVYGPIDERYIRDTYIARGPDNEEKFFGLSILESWDMEDDIVRAYKEDSVRYRLNGSIITRPDFHFAANVATVTTNHRIGIWKKPLPSLFRLDKFPANYGKEVPTPLFLQYQQNAAANYVSSSFLDGDKSAEIRLISDEASWQGAIKYFFLKNAVLWFFSRHYDEAKVSHQLYEIAKLEARFKDKPVVFVKCIEGSEYPSGDLTRYLEAFREWNMERDVMYFLKGNSLSELFQETNKPLVMDRIGHINHIRTDGLKLDSSIKPISVEEPNVIADEIEGVLDGRTLAFEPYTKEYLSNKEKTFTLYYKNGPYCIYKLIPPLKLNVIRDSIFQQITFKENQYWENTLELHGRPEGSSPAYDVAITNKTKSAVWEFDKESLILTLNGEKKQAFSVVLTGYDMLILKLL